MAELTDPKLRPRVQTEVVPEDLLKFVPDVKLKLEKATVLEALRTVGRGSAQDLSGTRYEHLRVLLEDEDPGGTCS